MDHPGFVLTTQQGSTMRSSCISILCPYRRKSSAPLLGGHVFSQMDFCSAHQQMELDDDSKRLCNINIHRGVNEYQRFPFGVKSDPGIFQAMCSQKFHSHPPIWTTLS
jgi:hypothetical protein